MPSSVCLLRLALLRDQSLLQNAESLLLLTQLGVFKPLPGFLGFSCVVSDFGAIPKRKILGRVQGRLAEGSLAVARTI